MIIIIREFLFLRNEKEIVEYFNKFCDEFNTVKHNFRDRIIELYNDEGEYVVLKFMSCNNDFTRELCGVDINMVYISININPKESVDISNFCKERNIMFEYFSKDRFITQQ